MKTNSYVSERLAAIKTLWENESPVSREDFFFLLDEAYRPGMLKYSLFLMEGNYNDAEDLLQDTLAKLCRCNLDGLPRNPGELKNYLWKCVKNMFLNNEETKRRKETGGIPPTEETSTINNIIFNIDYQWMLSHISSEKRRDCFDLHFQGYKHQEIIPFIEGIDNIKQVQYELDCARKELRAIAPNYFGA